jgi:CheY-like chemotaxis protein
MRKWKVLVVDDDAMFREAVEIRLKQEGYEVHTAAGEEEGRLKLAMEGLDLAIVDLRLRDDDPQDFGGLEVVSEAPHIPKIVVTRHSVPLLEFYAELERRGVQPRMLQLVPKGGKDGGVGKLVQACRKNLVPRVFIAHGHDREWRDRVRDYVVQQLGLRAFILANEPSGGETIIEQLEREADRMQFAIVLLTGDDRGYPGEKREETEVRARQNVIFELGYLAAKLGRDRLVMLVGSGVAMPSNIGGMRYVTLDGDWRDKLNSELRRTGIELHLYRPTASA